MARKKGKGKKRQQQNQTAEVTKPLNSIDTPEEDIDSSINDVASYTNDIEVTEHSDLETDQNVELTKGDSIQGNEQNLDIAPNSFNEQSHDNSDTVDGKPEPPREDELLEDANISNEEVNSKNAATNIHDSNAKDKKTSSAEDKSEVMEQVKLNSQVASETITNDVEIPVVESNNVKDTKVTNEPTKEEKAQNETDIKEEESGSIDIQQNQPSTENSKPATHTLETNLDNDDHENRDSAHNEGNSADVKTAELRKMDGDEVEINSLSDDNSKVDDNKDSFDVDLYTEASTTEGRKDPDLNTVMEDSYEITNKQEAKDFMPTNEELPGSPKPPPVGTLETINDTREESTPNSIRNVDLSVNNPPTLPPRKASTAKSIDDSTGLRNGSLPPELPKRTNIIDLKDMNPHTPELPKRDSTFHEETSVPKTKNAVPPLLEDEMKSDTFRKNVSRINKGDKINRRVSSVIDSAAEINLIANRFRVSSYQIEEVDVAIRKDIDAGQSLLKSTYTAILQDNETGEGSEKEEEDPEGKEIKDTDWAFWTRVVNDFANVANNESEKLEKEITDGIPRQIRGIIWQLIAHSKAKEIEDIYQTLSDTESPHEASIRRDLTRTNFLSKDNIESLFRVLKVYSVYDPDVGYTQGMAFVVTPLLLNCNSEAEAFGLLISLMKSYGLRDFFLPNMPGLMLTLYQFDRLLEETSPVLYNHLTREGVKSSMYATQWFLTFFAYKFPLEFVLRIFDIIFFEGLEAILKFAVNLMIKNKNTLLDLKFDNLLNFLKNELFEYYLKDKTSDLESTERDSVLHKAISTNSMASSSNRVNKETASFINYDVNLFVNEAMRDIHVTPISLNRYAAEYDDIHKLEHEKEMIYEYTRIKNHQLEKEARKLARDYELLNEEHVSMAKELIQNRLNIEMVLDENNDLEQNLENLQQQLKEEIDKGNMANPDLLLPSDLKQDLERTVERNSQVMSENVQLQERIGELEKTIQELKVINRTFANSSSVQIGESKSTASPTKSSSGWGFKNVFKKE